MSGFRKKRSSLHPFYILLHSIHPIQSFPFLITSFHYTPTHNSLLLSPTNSLPSPISPIRISTPITSSKQSINTIIPFNCVSPIPLHSRGPRFIKQMTSSFTSNSCFLLQYEAASPQTVLVRRYNHLYVYVCYGDRRECAKCRFCGHEVLLQRFL